jgi:exocyst complex component 2
VALRDYNKGKFLLESRPGQLLPGVLPNQNGTLDPQHKRIIEKVWGAVEKVMNELKNLLISKLKEPTQSVDDQGKTIEYVFALFKEAYG